MGLERVGPERMRLDLVGREQGPLARRPLRWVWARPEMLMAAVRVSPAEWRVGGWETQVRLLPAGREGSAEAELFAQPERTAEGEPFARAMENST